MSVLPDADFLHRLADIADAETLPRYRQPLDIETKERPGWTFDPVTEADRSAEVAKGRAPRHREAAVHAGRAEDTPAHPARRCLEAR